MPSVPSPDPAEAYADAPPVTAELSRFMQRTLALISGGTRPVNRADLLHEAAWADRSLLMAEETVASYGRRHTGPAAEARQLLAEQQEECARSAAALVNYDRAHDTRASAHPVADFGSGLPAQWAYVRQEYAAA